MITLKHLKILRTLFFSESLSETAVKLHQTQSTLSHSLNKLEKNLGFQLFIRRSKPIIFTKQGKLLLKLSEQILPIVDQFIEKCNTIHQKKINIAIECHNCIQWLIPALKKFKKKWPKINLNYKSNMVFNPQLELKKGTLDLVITSEILITNDIFYFPIFDFELRLILAPDHPLTKKKSIITPTDLKSETLIMYPVPKNKLDIWTHFLNPAGIKPIFRNVDNTLLLIQMVSANMGIAALPNWVVDNFEKQGLISTRSLGMGMWGRLYAAMLDGKQYQSIILSFINSIKKNCDHQQLKFINHKFR